MKKGGTAVLIVDMQREFLTAEGMFKRPVSGKALVEPLSTLINAARIAKHTIVWIKSAYPERKKRPVPWWPQRPSLPRFSEVPMNSELLASGHAGRPCCVPGSELCDLYPPLEPLVQPEDLQITKERYSAFSQTALADKLRVLGIERIFLCGVVANMCVRATAADAFFLGFEVFAVQDCIGATSNSLLREGLSSIARWYGEVLPSALVLSRWGTARMDLGAGDSGALYGVLPPSLETSALTAVREEVSWQEMRHRGGLVPRQIAIQGALQDGAEPVYRHPADEQPALVPFTPMVEKLRKIVEERISQKLNHVLIQRYTSGKDYISPHADKTLDILRGSTVVNLSLGATRTMLLVSKKRDKDGQHRTYRIELPHASLFLLGWKTNRAFQHGIRPDRRPDQQKRPDERRNESERISLTFRSVATFQLPSGQLTGQGARRDDVILDERDEAQTMLHAFSQENKDCDFDWDLHYGSGFRVLNFRVLRGKHV